MWIFFLTDFSFNIKGYFHLYVNFCYLFYTQIITIMWNSSTY